MLKKSVLSRMLTYLIICMFMTRVSFMREIECDPSYSQICGRPVVQPSSSRMIRGHPVVQPFSSLVIRGGPVVQPASSRIVGGYPAVIGAWPWTVILAELGYPVCGGAIIHKRAILTAAHCFKMDQNKDVRRWQVVAGKYHLKDPQEGTYYQVQSINIHEDYERSTVSNDLAILLLRNEISYTELIRPICLPEVTQKLSIGQLCFIAGFGDTKGTSDRYVMNQVMVPIISDNVCSQPDWYGKAFLPQLTFCAGYQEGFKDACEGDSGSPLVCKFGDHWIASGLSSWGYSCGEEKWPGIYSNVSYHLPWITRKLRELGLNVPCSSIVG